MFTLSTRRLNCNSFNRSQATLDQSGSNQAMTIGIIGGMRGYYVYIGPSMGSVTRTSEIEYNLRYDGQWRSSYQQKKKKKKKKAVPKLAPKS